MVSRLRLPFRLRPPSDDEDETNTFLRLAPPHMDLMGVRRQASIELSTPPLVQRWEVPTQNWDIPLSNQVHRDCNYIFHSLRRRLYQYSSIHDHPLRQSLWQTESIIGSLYHKETLTSHSGCVNSINWIHEGSCLISSGDDCRLVITDYSDLSKQTIIHTGHTENVFCVRGVPAKSEWIVTCSGDHQIRLFDLNTCQLILTYEGHRDRVKKFVIPSWSSSSSLAVYSCSDDGTVKLIDLRAKVKAAATPRSNVEPIRNERFSGRAFRRLTPLFDDVPFVTRQARRSSNNWSSILNDRRDGGPDTVAIFKQGGRRFTSTDRPTKPISSISISTLRPEYIVIGGELPVVWLLDRRLLGRPSSGSRLVTQTEPIAEFKPQGRPKCQSITGVDISHDGRRVIGSWSGERIYQFNIEDREEIPDIKMNYKEPRLVKLKSRSLASDEVKSISRSNDSKRHLHINNIKSASTDDIQSLVHHHKRLRTEFGPQPAPSRHQWPSSISISSDNSNIMSDSGNHQREQRRYIMSSRYRRSNSRRDSVVASRPLHIHGSTHNNDENVTPQSVYEVDLMNSPRRFITDIVESVPDPRRDPPTDHLQRIRSALHRSRRRLQLESLQNEGSRTERFVNERSELPEEKSIVLPESPESEVNAIRRRSEGNLEVSTFVPRRSVRIQESMRRRSLEQRARSTPQAPPAGPQHGREPENGPFTQQLSLGLARIRTQSVRLRQELARLRRAAFSVGSLIGEGDQSSSSSNEPSGNGAESEDCEPVIVSESDDFNPFVFGKNFEGDRRRTSNGSKRRLNSITKKKRMIENSDVANSDDDDDEHCNMQCSDSDISENKDDDDDDEVGPILDGNSRSRNQRCGRQRGRNGSFSFVPPNTFIWRAEESSLSNRNGRRGTQRRGTRAEGDSLTSGLSSMSSSDSDSVEQELPGAFSFGCGKHRSLNSGVFSEVPHSQVFKGHCNRRTIKEVSYLGSSSEWVTSGSDDGRFFIWNQATGKLVFIGHNADSEVVNCVVDHPKDLVVATSGIDSNVKIWRAGPLKAFNRRSEKIRNIILDNERQRDSQPSFHSFTFQHAMLFFQLLETARTHQRQASGGANIDDHDDNSEVSQQIAR